MRVHDDFPYSSDDPSLEPFDDNSSGLSLTSQQLSDLKATLRLVVGSTLNGRDAYIQRLRLVQSIQGLVNPDAITIGENETIRDQLRYFFLGMLFETPDVLQRGLVRAEKASSKVYGFVSKLLSPISNSWIFSPVKDRYDVAAERGEKIVDRLIMKGRIEEQNSRLITQQKALDDLVNDILEYVILRTEVLQIVQEGGVGVATDVLDVYREQSASVDTVLEQRLKSFFHRIPPKQPGTPPSKPAEGG